MPHDLVHEAAWFTENSVPERAHDRLEVGGAVHHAGTVRRERAVALQEQIAEVDAEVHFVVEAIGEGDAVSHREDVAGVEERVDVDEVHIAQGWEDVARLRVVELHRGDHGTISVVLGR